MSFHRAFVYAFRVLAHAPSFALTVILVLALGIAVNTAVFTIVDQVLLNPFPYEAPNRLSMLWESNPALGELASSRVPVAWTNFEAWRTQNHSFAALEAIQVPLGYNLTGVKIPESLVAARATPGFFPMLGINAAVGRTFLPGDDSPGTNPTVVITYSFSLKHFPSSSPLGQRLLLDGRPHTIIGVLPSKFRLPAFFAGISEYRPDIWVPLPAVSINDPPQTTKRRRLLVFGRLKPNISLPEVRKDLAAIAERRAKEDPVLNNGYGVNIFSLNAENTDPDLRRALDILLSAAFVLLLLACINLAGLIFVRASARKKFLAIMAALGASRWSLLTPTVSESLILGSTAGLLGLLFAYAGVHAIVLLKPASIFAPERIAINLHSFLFAAFISLVAILILGILPAWLITRTNLNAALKSSPTATIRSPRRSVARLSLVAIEIATALTFTITATLLTRSFQRLLTVDPGFKTQGILTAHLSLAPQRYPKPEDRISFCQRLRQQLQSFPGIRSAAFVDNMPLYAIRYTQFEIEGHPLPQTNAAPTADDAHVLPGFLETMGVTLRRGRYFTDLDAQSSPAQVVILNETVAHQFWPNQDPIGSHIRELIPNKPPGPWQTVIGIVSDFVQFNVETPARPEIFWPATDFTDMTMVLRSVTANPSSLSIPLQQTVAALDPDQPVSDIQTLQEMIDYGTSQPRFNTLVLNLFAALSILLTLVGVYGLISSFISAHIRDIGVHFALGAQRKHLCFSLLRPVLPPVFIGIALGLLSSFLAKGLIAAILFQTSPHDLLTYISMPAAFVCIVVLTALAATRRIAAIDPSNVLRQE